MMQHALSYTIAFILSLVGATSAYSATYYVAPEGNDSNPGTITQPFRSIARGVSPLNPGDTLYLREGTYIERIDLATPKKTGTTNAWLTIAGYPGETVTIRYTSPTEASYGPIRARGNRGYILFDNLVLDGVNETNKTKWQITDGNHHFILRNLEIKNFKSSGLYIEGNDITVTNCKIHDGNEASAELKRFYGIYAHHGNNILIENTEIFNQPGGGLHLYPGPLTNLIVRGNFIHHNNRMANTNFGGIILQGHSTNNIVNAKIYNNVIFRNGTLSSGSASGIVIGYHTKDTKIWNNTVYGNTGYGLQVGYDSTTANTMVQNNILFGNAYGDYINKGIETIYDHNLTNDPKFIKPDANDFRLQPRSSAIDGGTALNEVGVDIRGISRPRGVTHDIGAHEDSGASADAVNAPKDLHLR